MKRKDIYTLLFGVLCCAGTSLCFSCADDLEIGKQFDESALEGIYENRVFLCDASSNKFNNIIELYTSNQYSTKVRMSLSKNSSAETSAKIVIDESYLENYNQEHNTDFEMLPASAVIFANDGTLNSGNCGRSLEVEMTIKISDDLEAGKTYALPLSITEPTSDLTIKNEQDRHCVYLVKDMRKFGDAFKGEDKPKGFLFFEVNDVNPLNALSFQLENGKYFWDVVVLFAANINYDSEAGRPYIKCNPNVQYLLDNNETLLQPLRKRGIKVLLGLLGNHDMAGLAQLSTEGAKVFAREIAQYCKAYNLDGVNYDDEYSLYPDLDNPSFATPSAQAGARLCYETKQVMPDKLVTVFAYGNMYGVESVDGVDVDEWIDIVVPNYGSAAYPLGNMGKWKCAGLAAEFNLNGGGSLDSYGAQKILSGGYGWHMGFAANPSNYRTIFRRLSGAYELYGSKLKDPTIFYKKNETTPSKYPEDL